MKLSHRTLMVLAAIVLILPALGAAEDKAKDEAAAPWRLATDAHAALQLQAAADYIRDADWPNALRLLQHLLDGLPDTLARLAGRAGKAERIVSVPAEAERMLASLPQAGRKAYQHTYGPRAADLLAQARQVRDTELLSRIVGRYQYTDAGPAALGELARRYAKEGRFAAAALGYARLLEHVGPARWTNEDLYHAAVAFHHHGRSAHSGQVLKHLLARTGQKGVRLGDRKLTVAELQKEIARAAASPRPLEWPLYRGDATRSNRGVSGPPLLDPIWRRSMFYGRDGSGKAASEKLRRAEKQLQDKQEPIIPAFSPIALIAQDHKGKKTPLLIYKNYFGVFAIDVRDGNLAWMSGSNLSLQHLLGEKKGSTQASVVSWLNFYENLYPQVLFENSTVGTLSTDGEFVYVVEDLAVPPMPQPNVNNGFGGAMNRLFALDPELADAVGHNRLYALSLPTNGKLVWELPADEKGPLAGCYFLGPPLPLDGLLYVLIQKNKQVSLLCLDPKHRDKKTQALQPKIVFLKPLVEVAVSLLDDPLRRIRAAHLAYADSILVCPTNAGVVVGVDVLTNRLVWAYPYRDKNEAPEQPALINGRFRGGQWPLPGFRIGPDGSWKVTAPVISDGKVVFTAPDARSLHCINLADGSLLWSHKKDRDYVYLAGVHDGKVLIVGTKNVQALSLATGASLWTQETGLPSGQGIAAADRYYLPLQRGTQSKKPEILVLDLAKGQVIAHIPRRPRLDFEAPGNLVFFEGKLISQSPWEIVAYPRLQDEVDKVNERLKEQRGREP